MANTKPGRHRHPRSSTISGGSDYYNYIGGHRSRASGVMQTINTTPERSRIIEDGKPEVASSSSAFISGVKAAGSASLGLIPFAIALGATAVGSGLSGL